MISTQTSVTLIHNLVVAEAELVKAINTPRGATKRCETEERKAITALFRALTGDAPTPEQMAEITKM